MKGLCPELEPVEFWQTLRRCSLIYPYVRWISETCPDRLHEISISLPLGGVIEISVWHFTIWPEDDVEADEERSSLNIYLHNCVYALSCFLNQPCASHLSVRPWKNTPSSRYSRNWTLEDVKKAVQFLVDHDNAILDNANQNSLILAGVLRKRLGLCKDLSTLIAKMHYDLALRE